MCDKMNRKVYVGGLWASERKNMKMAESLRKPVAAFSLALLFASAAFADGRTLTWQGASGGAWSVAENWLDGDVTATSAPADGDVLRFVNTSALTTVNDLDGLTVGGLKLENTKALTVSGNAFAFTGEITMNQPTANVVDTFSTDIDLKSDLVVRFQNHSNKTHQLKFTGVLSGTGGLAVDTTSGSGDSQIHLLGLNTFTGDVAYTGNNGYVCTYFNTIAVGGQPSSFGAGTGGVTFVGRLYATGTGGTTDRAWTVKKTNGWDLGNTNPLVFESTFDFGGNDISFTGKGTLKFEGQVKNLAKVSSTNGNKLYFNSPDNTASAAKDVVLQNADLYAKKLANSGSQSSIGTGSLIQLGQGYDTASGLFYTGTDDALCDRTIDVICPAGKNIVHTLSVQNAGTELELSGTIKSSTSTTPVLTLAGAGDLRTSGTMQSTYSVNKTGAGKWTHSGTATYTGTTTVSAGSFVLDGSLASPLVVKSGATLSGTGTAGGDVTLQGGATYSVADLEHALAISGKLTVSGNITVTVPSSWDGTAQTILTYASASSAGTITVSGCAFEGKAVLDENGLVIQRGGESLARTWTGAVNGSWDTATANWADAQLFSDGCEVTFPAGAANREVTLPTDVKVGAMAVAGDDDYAFSGGAIRGKAILDKTGTGCVTFSNQTQFAAVNLTEGALTLGEGGALADSAVTVSKGTTLTVEEGASVDGESALTVNGSYVNRSAQNTYTGDTRLLNTTTVYTDRTFGAPEAGYVSVEGQNAVLMFGTGVFLRKRIHKLNNDMKLWGPKSGRAGLYGDFSHASGTGRLELEDQAEARDTIFELGEPNGTNRLYNTSTAAGDAWGITVKSRLIYSASGCEINARLFYQNSGTIEVHNGGRVNYLQINSTSNKWANTVIREGLLRVGADEALAPDAKTYAIVDTAAVWGCLDLRGHKQTLNDFTDRESETAAMAGAFDIRSTGGHGTLILGGTGVLLRPRTRFTGDLDIVKRGVDAFEFAFGGADAVSDQTGAVRIEEGALKASTPGVFGGATNIAVSAGATLDLRATDTLGAARACCLDVASGATLSIPAGVTVTVAYAHVGASGSDGKPLARGSYTKTNCPAISGDGTLVVSRGVNGIVLLVR